LRNLSRISLYIMILLIVAGGSSQIFTYDSLILSSKSYTSQPSCLTYSIYIPAVSERGGGEMVKINVLSVANEKNLSIIGVEEIGLDTLISLLVAYITAERTVNPDLGNYGIYMIFPSQTRSVRGPSAGLMFFYIFSNIGKEIYENISGTGALNLDGVIESIGGVYEKISAAKSLGVIKIFYVPSSNYLAEDLYKTSWRDIKLIPVSSIEGFSGYHDHIYTNYSDKNLYQDPMMKENIHMIQKIYEQHIRNEFIKGLETAQLYNITLARDIYYMYDLYESMPKDDELFLARTNILYLNSINLYSYILAYLYNYNKDLYNKLSNQMISYIRESLRKIEQNINKIDISILRSKDLMNIYLLYLTRVYDLIKIYRDNRNFSDIYDYNDLSRAYMRSISLDLWNDLLNLYLERYVSYKYNITEESSYIEDYKKKIDLMFTFLNISHREGYEYYNLLRRYLIINGSEEKIKFLKVVSEIMYLKDLFYNYSYTLRYSSLINVYTSSGVSGLKKLYYDLDYIDPLTKYFEKYYDIDPISYEFNVAIKFFIERSLEENLTITFLRLWTGLDVEMLSNNFILNYLYDNISIPLVNIKRMAEIPNECVMSSGSIGVTRLLESSLPETYHYVKMIVSMMIISISILIIIVFSIRTYHFLRKS